MKLYKYTRFDIGKQIISSSQIALSKPQDFNDPFNCVPVSTEDDLRKAINIYLLGIIGLFEFCYDNGLILLVPNNFTNYKERRLEKQTKDYIYTFLDKETDFLHEHEQLRIDELMSIIGLSTHDHSLVKSEVIRARLSPMYNIETAQKNWRTSSSIPT